MGSSQVWRWGFPPAPDIDTSRAGREHVIRSGRVIHCLVPWHSPFIIETFPTSYKQRTCRDYQWPGQQHSLLRRYDTSMECDAKKRKSLSAIFLPARGGCLGCLTSPLGRYFNAAISVVAPMFHSRHGITNRNREGQNICISAEWREAPSWPLIGQDHSIQASNWLTILPLTTLRVFSGSDMIANDIALLSIVCKIKLPQPRTVPLR